MNALSGAIMPAVSKPYRAILVGGLLSGTLDITAAIIFYGLLRGRAPIRILQSIASGLLGMDAYNGDVATAALGLFFQYLIATTAAGVYYLASRKLKFLIQNPFLCGPLYGVAVFFFMNLVVLPLSAFPYPVSFPIRALITGLTIHVFCVGLPIALASSWYSTLRQPRFRHSYIGEIE